MTVGTPPAKQPHCMFLLGDGGWGARAVSRSLGKWPPLRRKGKKAGEREVMGKDGGTREGRGVRGLV